MPDLEKFFTACPTKASNEAVGLAPWKRIVLADHDDALPAQLFYDVFSQVVIGLGSRPAGSYDIVLSFAHGDIFRCGVSDDDRKIRVIFCPVHNGHTFITANRADECMNLVSQQGIAKFRDCLAAIAAGIRFDQLDRPTGNFPAKLLKGQHNTFVFGCSKLGRKTGVGPGDANAYLLGRCYRRRSDGHKSPNQKSHQNHFQSFHRLFLLPLQWLGLDFQVPPC